MTLGWRGQYSKYREFSLNLLALYKGRSDLQAFLEIILSLTTLIIFIVFAIKPTAITIVGLTQEIKTKEETLSNLNQKITDLQVAYKLVSENEEVIPILDTAIFNIPQPDTIAKQVLGIAQKNSVTVSGMSMGKTVFVGDIALADDADKLDPISEGAKTMSLSFNANGDYTNLIAFLTDLENSRVPVRIDMLTMSTVLTDTEKILTLQINGRIPYLGKKNN
jgi:hypothetical protein